MTATPSWPHRRGGPGRGRLMSRAALGLLAAAAVLFGPAPPAQAHAFLAASNPADGQVLATAPTQLRLDFSESVVLSATRIDIVDGSGRDITTTGLTLVSHGGDGGTEEPVEVVADLPPLSHSSYRVTWETLSSDDLHATSGLLVFGVGQAVTASGLNEPSPSLVEAGLRWVILLGLAGALGGALAGRLLLRAGGERGLDGARRARGIRGRGSVIGAGAAAVLLAVQLAQGRAGGAALLWGSYGLRWGVREAGLLLLAASAMRRARPAPASRWRLLLPSGAVLACVGTALLGHSGAGATLNVTRVIAAAAHLGAAVTWAGCLVVLAILTLRRGRRGDPSRELARSALRAFGPPAALCVGVMVVTGVYLSSKVVGSVDAALLTGYGRTLLAKVLLAGVAGSLALVNTLRLHRGPERATPRRTVIAEAVVALGVLALAGVLTSSQPAMEPQLVKSTSQASTVVDGAVADLQETVSISPNRPGAGVVLVEVFDTRRPSPAPVREVLVSVLDASGRGEPQVAEHLSNGRWSLSTRLVDPGPVRLQVLVRRSGLPDATRSFGWTVGGGPATTRAAVVSTEPVRGLLERVATVLAGLLLLALVLVPWVRRRRRDIAPGGPALTGQPGPEAWAERDDTSRRAGQRVGASTGSRQ